MIHRSLLAEPVVPDTDLVSFVLERASARSSAVALRDGVTGETVTYGELVGSVDAGARVLRAVGVGPGSVVALISPNQPAWVVAFYAALRAGAAVTPVNPAATDREITEVVAASGADVIVVDAGIEERVRAALGDGRTLVVIAGARGGLAVVGVSASSVPAPGARLALPDPGSVAALPFSSGTTGLAKGVRLTHRNLVATLVQHADVYHVTDADVVLAALPMFHVYGMSIITNYALRHGATIVTMPRFELTRFCALIRSERVTWLHLAPPIVLSIAGLAGDGSGSGYSRASTDVGSSGRGGDFASVRRAVSGAAPLDAGAQRRAEAVLGCPIGQGYGMTEAAPGITFVPDRPLDAAPGAPPPGAAAGSVGVLVAGTTARLVDPATGSDVDDPAAPGELWVRGPQVMAGYLDATATAAAVVQGGWLRTGDIARVDPDGTWWIVDRLKEMIKYKGFQVAPAELEALLLGHAGVVDAAVVGRDDPAAGEVPVGFVQVTADSGLTPAELLAWIAERVAPYKRLRDVILVDGVPKSASGKVLRRELKRMYLTGS